MKIKITVKPDAPEMVAAQVQQEGTFTQQLRELVSEHNGADKLLAYTEDDIKLLSPAEIECVSVNGGKTYAVTASGEQFRLKQRLYELEETLPSCFIKINKSCIGNKTRIERYSAAFSGAVSVHFKSGHTDYVSRRCFAAIKKELRLK